MRYTYLRPQEPSDNSAPLLLLHGFGAALEQWRTNLIPLSQQHTVYALDFLGFGASHKAATVYSVALWQTQVYEFWQTFIRQPVVLVGHSLGALVALSTAVQYPDMVKGLVLLTLPAARQELLSGPSGAIASQMERWFANPLLLSPVFWFFRRSRVIRAALRFTYANPNAVTDEVVSRFIAPALDRGAAEVFFRLSEARTQADFSPSTKTLLQHLDRPTLMLWGASDRIIPLTWGRQLPPLNPHLKLVEIPDAGHCLYDECADSVNQEILSWVNQLQRESVFS